MMTLLIFSWKRTVFTAGVAATNRFSRSDDSGRETRNRETARAEKREMRGTPTLQCVPRISRGRKGGLPFAVLPQSQSVAEAARHQRATVALPGKILRFTSSNPTGCPPITNTDHAAARATHAKCQSAGASALPYSKSGRESDKGCVYSIAGSTDRQRTETPLVGRCGLAASPKTALSLPHVSLRTIRGWPPNPLLLVL